MSVKVTYNCYINLCEDYMYGKKFLALPEKIKDAIDKCFDGAELEAFQELFESGKLEGYIEQHLEEIKERLRVRYYFLGYVDNQWHVFV